MESEVIYLKFCKVCRTPIRGLRSWPYRLRGIHPFHKNPHLCNQCGHVKFPPVEKEITVMFADVRGYTSLSEQMPLAELRRLINLFFAQATKLLIENDALIDKFLGDAVMALFNAPIPQSRHREAALKTAIALQEEIAKLKLPLAIGVGINTGMVVTGNVGHGEVTDYTAMGDPVNVASRLCGLAKKGEILAGIDTCESLMGALSDKGLAQILPQGYRCERVTLQVKGKANLVSAYRIYPVSV